MVWSITHAHTSLLLTFTTTLALNITTATTLVVLAGLTKVVIFITLAFASELTINCFSHTFATVVASRG
jgi:hypothetical protein